MKKYILGISLMIAIVVVAVAACSKSGTGDTPTPTNPSNPSNPSNPTTADAAVTISGFAFSPAVTNIKVGKTVEWTNKDAAAHTATDLNGAFNSGNINQGGKFSFKFTTAGTYTFHCLIHATMATAKVVVTE